MNLDSHDVVQKVNTHLVAYPNATLRSVAERLGIAGKIIEDALREIEGVTFQEFQAGKRMIHAFEQLGQINPAAIGFQETNRARRRWIIPKTTVRYQTHILWIRKSSFSNAWPLADLSTDGLAFFADQAPRPGQHISLLLKFPGGEEIPQLEGRVVYAVATGIAGYRYRVGIQFLPFTDRKGCNSTKALEVLVNMEKTYVP